ncbi:plantaricin C family lantibiotic [Blautia obeum]|nr:plantaricin C family lantibiotic [Blautia obeum]
MHRRNFTHPAGNTMTELKEAELNNFAAGAGEPRNSGGMFCTSTGECNMGTLNIFCC